MREPLIIGQNFSRSILTALWIIVGCNVVFIFLSCSSIRPRWTHRAPFILMIKKTVLFLQSADISKKLVSPPTIYIYVKQKPRLTSNGISLLGPVVLYCCPYIYKDWILSHYAARFWSAEYNGNLPRLRRLQNVAIRFTHVRGSLKKTNHQAHTWLTIKFVKALAGTSKL